MLFTVYKTTNLINDKIYIGFHKISNMTDLISTESIYSSIFSDGYLGSGKLIKRAIEKYGPENMKQELLLVTEDEEEAAQLEKELVNRVFIERDDTYNLSIGGKVCILFGENNGYFGKKHTKETIEHIQKKRNETLKNSPFSWCEIIDNETGIIIYNRDHLCQLFNIDPTLKRTEKRYLINELIYNGIISYKSKYLQDIAIKDYENRISFLNSAEERRTKKAKIISDRFKGVSKTKESNEKRGKSISEWIQNNPEKHKERMNKINTNPDRLRKMIEKQTGKIWITNTETNKNTRHDPKLEIPPGWIKGFRCK